MGRCYCNNCHRGFHSKCNAKKSPTAIDKKTFELPPPFRLGQKFGQRAVEVWRGIEYICFLLVNSKGMYATTHNAMLDDEDQRFIHSTAEAAILAAYMRR